MSTAEPQMPLEDLMRLAQRGDKGAYAELFQAITPLLKAFVARRLSSHADMEDLVQEILLSIHRASHTYDTDRPFKVWMFSIARYRLNDHLRRIYGKDRRLETSTEDISEIVEETSVIDTYESHEYINKALATLPEKQQKILTLMKVEGYSAEETAKTMSMSVSAVKISAHRSYKALFKMMERQDN